jgi:hypothetical protein
MTAGLPLIWVIFGENAGVKTTMRSVATVSSIMQTATNTKQLTLGTLHLAQLNTSSEIHFGDFKSPPQIFYSSLAPFES